MKPTLRTSEKSSGDESRYLLPSERRVISVRRHWILLVLPVLATLAALFAAGWLTGSMRGTDGPLDNIIWILAAMVVCWSAWRALEWHVSRFIVTDKRILLTSGFLTRRVGMMPLRKVTDMTYERTLVGQLGGFGTFVMESAGQDQALHRIEYLPHPDQLYREVSDLLFGSSPQAAQIVYDPDEA